MCLAAVSRKVSRLPPWMGKWPISSASRAPSRTLPQFVARPECPVKEHNVRMPQRLRQRRVYRTTSGATSSAPRFCGPQSDKPRYGRPRGPILSHKEAAPRGGKLPAPPARWRSHPRPQVSRRSSGSCHATPQNAVRHCVIPLAFRLSFTAAVAWTAIGGPSLNESKPST